MLYALNAERTYSLGKERPASHRLARRLRIGHRRPWFLFTNLRGKDRHNRPATKCLTRHRSCQSPSHPPRPYIKATRTWNDRRMVCLAHPLWKPLGAKIRNMRRKGSTPSARASSPPPVAARAGAPAATGVEAEDTGARQSSTPRTSSLYGLTRGIYTIHQDPSGVPGQEVGMKRAAQAAEWGGETRDSAAAPCGATTRRRLNQAHPPQGQLGGRPPGAWCSRANGK